MRRPAALAAFLLLLPLVPGSAGALDCTSAEEDVVALEAVRVASRSSSCANSSSSWQYEGEERTTTVHVLDQGVLALGEREERQSYDSPWLAYECEERRDTAVVATATVERHQISCEFPRGLDAKRVESDVVVAREETTRIQIAAGESAVDGASSNRTSTSATAHASGPVGLGATGVAWKTDSSNPCADGPATSLDGASFGVSWSTVGCALPPLS